MVKQTITTMMCIMLILFCGCAPQAFVPREYPKVTFEKTPDYKLNIEDIKVPEKPVNILLDENFKQVTDSSKAKYVVYTQQEFAKVVSHLKVREAYKDIAVEQEVLINSYIATINSLKEYIALEQAKSEQYKNLWVNSENMFRQEQYSHQIDNIFNRSILGIITVGAMVIVILAL